MKDKELIKYEAEERRKNPYRYQNSEVERPGLCRILYIKFKLMYSGISTPVLSKFFTFLILQGLMMPQFYDFDYFFAIDVLKIPLPAINLQSLVTGWLVVLIPFVYQRYFIDKNYIYMMSISQYVYVIAETVNLALAMQWNKAVGIPNIFLYFLGGAIAGVFERGFFYFPAMIIISKSIPPGIESTMYSLSLTILSLNGFILRSALGVIINDNFIFVSNAHMENFAYLKVIQIVTSMLPLLYMWKFVPTLKETDDLQKHYTKQRQSEEGVELINQQDLEGKN